MSNMNLVVADAVELKTVKKSTWVERNLPTFAGLAAVSVGAAHAAGTGIDTSGITSALTDAGSAVAVVGAAVLLVYVGIKAYKMIKGAL